MEERMARIEGILEEHRIRLNHLESRVDGGFSELRHEINELRREISRLLRWMISIMLGILIPMWVSIILTILFH